MQLQVTVPSAKYSPHIHRVAIFGSADITQDDPVFRDAFEAAMLLAQEGKMIVDGGGPGVMQAATMGANSVKGKTLSVTFYPTDAPNFEGRFLNNITDKEIRTKNYIERMFTLMDNADAFVIFKGGTGTLSEWTTAWVMAHLYYGHHKPFVLFGSWWHEVIDVMQKNFLLGETEMKVFKIADNAQDMLYIFDEFEAEMREREATNQQQASESQGEQPQ